MTTRRPDIPDDVARLLEQESESDATLLREVWELARDSEDQRFPHTGMVARMWETIQDRIRESETTDRTPIGPRRERLPVRRTALRRVAITVAGVAAVIVIGVVTYLWMTRSVTRSAEPGQIVTALLPDGSTVELNSGSRVEYGVRFWKKRGVHLFGEAFFDVVSDEKPFLVRTFDTEIEVVGTRFNVRSWQGGYESATVVTVESGRVAVRTPTYDEEVILAPGQRFGTGEDGFAAEVDSLIVKRATAWRRGELVYKDEKLGVVIADVERRFGVDLQIAPSLLGETRVTVAERNPVDAESLVQVLAVALELNYRETANGFEVYRESED